MSTCCMNGVVQFQKKYVVSGVLPFLPISTQSSELPAMVRQQVTARGDLEATKRFARTSAKKKPYVPFDGAIWAKGVLS